MEVLPFSEPKLGSRMSSAGLSNWSIGQHIVLYISNEILGT